MIRLHAFGLELPAQGISGPGSGFLEPRMAGLESRSIEPASWSHEFGHPEEIVACAAACTFRLCAHGVRISAVELGPLGIRQ